MRQVYSLKTRFLELPVRNSNDRLDGVTELNKWQKVEQAMLSSTRMMRHVSYSEGDLELHKTPDGKINAMLGPNPPRPAFEGMAKGVYLKVARPIMWEDIGKGQNFAYLYILPMVGGDPSQCTTFTRPCETRTDGHLIAVVDIKNMTFDMCPKDKLSTEHMANHHYLTENPHGDSLVQKSIVSDKIDVKEAVIGSEIIRPTASRVFDVDLKGSEGVLVSVGFPVRFVNWSAMDATVKSVWFGYSGIDTKVIDPNTVMVYSDVVAKVRIMAW